MYQITVTSDFFADQQKSDALPKAEHFTGPMIAAFMDSSGQTWYAFELPDVFGVWVINQGSRFLVSITPISGGQHV